MYIKIDNTEYRSIRNLSFAPETSVLSDCVPINQFTLDVMTDDAISAGADIELYDDIDTLWATYWVTYAERLDDFTISLRAESKISILDRKTMPAVMYSNEPVSDILSDVFSDLGSSSYSLDSSFSGASISGFMPHHSKRYRLQLICFVIGAYVKTYFNDKIEILPLSANALLVPKKKTFWKPSVTYKDWVTGITIRSFSFQQGTPATGDDYVKDDQGVTYIQSSQEITVTNPDAPVTAPPNIIEVDDVQIINSGNVSAILARLASMYFGRAMADVDVINNAEYMPGQRVITYGVGQQLVMGYIESATFSFGVQARSKIHMTPIELREAVTLTIRYTWSELGTKLRVLTEEYLLPKDYQYTIENPYIDLAWQNHRYVLRPRDEYTTVTLSADSVIEMPCYAALDNYKNVLTVTSVDEVTVSSGEADIS